MNDLQLQHTIISCVKMIKCNPPLAKASGNCKFFVLFCFFLFVCLLALEIEGCIHNGEIEVGWMFVLLIFSLLNMHSSWSTVSLIYSGKNPATVSLIYSGKNPVRWSKTQLELVGRRNAVRVFILSHGSLECIVRTFLLFSSFFKKKIPLLKHTVIARPILVM